VYTASPGRIQRPSWSLSTTTYWWPPGVGVEVGLQGDAGQHLGGGPVDQPEPVVAGQADRGGQVVEVDATCVHQHTVRDALCSTVSECGSFPGALLPVDQQAGGGVGGDSKPSASNAR